SNQEYDRLADRLNTTLARDQRIQQMSEMSRRLSEELPAISLYYDLSPMAFVSALKGPAPVAPDTSGLVAWNVVDGALHSASRRPRCKTSRPASGLPRARSCGGSR